MDFNPNLFELDECCSWILDNNFQKIALQLKLEDLKFSVEINNYLKEKLAKQTNKPIDLYITQSSTCCVDLLVTQHVTNLDAMIHFGNVCLSKPHLNNQETHLPILFAFGKPSSANDIKFETNIQIILNELEAIKEQFQKGEKILIYYDTSLTEYALELDRLLQLRDAQDIDDYYINIDIAKLNCLDSNWTVTENFKSRFITIKNSDIKPFGFYVFPDSSAKIEQYSCGIYLGNNLSIYHTLEGPKKLYKFDCVNSNFEIVDRTKELNKRVALLSRLKEEVELNIGVIITNPLPNISLLMQTLETYSKPRKHTLYYISMIQTIDECKIGNFDLCDAFVVVNSCCCSTILKSLFFNRPIISEIEYKLACGFEAKYGGILWQGSTVELSDDDLINRRKVSDVSLALVHTRNELLERCSQARTNKWSGMDYGGAVVGDGTNKLSGKDTGESLEIEEGLMGIASSYKSEPLHKI